MLAADGIPAHNLGEGTALLTNQLGIGPLAHVAQKGVPVGVPAGSRPVHAVVGVVIPTLPVLGLMIDDTVLYLRLGNVQVALIVGAVVYGVPQAPFHQTPDVDVLGFLGFVGQHQIVEFTVFAHGDEEGHPGIQAVLSAVKGGVAHAMAALVTVKLGLGGKVPGIPGGLSRFLDVVEAAALVAGNGVVAVAQQTLQLGIPIEAVAAARIGNHAQEILTAQVVDPGQGSGGGGNDVLPPGIIEMTEFHMCTLLTCHGCGNDND